MRAVNRPHLALTVAIAACALVTAGCGEDGQEVDSRGATLFAERCAGCHTLEAAGTEGTNPAERVAGPNLNQRRETKEQVLYAIRNGGFSGAIMPQNIVVGEDAEAVAEFVAEYAGKSATGPPGLTPGGGANEARDTEAQGGSASGQGGSGGGSGGR
jgi:mono/diheme cytochrome c family protein